MNDLQKKIEYEKLIKKGLQQLSSEEVELVWKIGRECLIEMKSKIKMRQEQGLDTSQLSMTQKYKMSELAEIDREMIRRKLPVWQSLIKAP